MASTDVGIVSAPRVGFQKLFLPVGNDGQWRGLLQMRARVDQKTLAVWRNVIKPDAVRQLQSEQAIRGRDLEVVRRFVDLGGDEVAVAVDVIEFPSICASVRVAGPRGNRDARPWRGE